MYDVWQIYFLFRIVYTYVPSGYDKHVSFLLLLFLYELYSTQENTYIHSSTVCFRRSALLPTVPVKVEKSLREPPFQSFAMKFTRLIG